MSEEEASSSLASQKKVTIELTRKNNKPFDISFQYSEKKVDNNTFVWIPRKRRRSSSAAKQQQQKSNTNNTTKQQQQQLKPLKAKKQLTQQQHQKARTTDIHLGIRNKMRGYLEIFSKLAISGIHPAILQETNLEEYLLEDSHLSDNLSLPLSFNISVALCIGAQAAGDSAAETEFWMKAREQVGELFDTNDYQVAAGLQRLSEYATNKGLLEQGQYYAVLGARICEQAHRRNTSVYMWLMYRLHLAERNQPEFVYKLQHAQKEQHWPASTTPNDYDDAASLDYIELDMVYQKIVARMSLLYFEGMTNLHNTALLTDLCEMSMQLAEEWKDVKHLFNLGQQLRLELIMHGFMGRVLWCLGRKEEAEREAMHCYRVIEHPLTAFIQIMPVGVVNVLTVLQGTQRLSHLQATLKRLQPRQGGKFLNGVLEEFTRFL